MKQVDLNLINKKIKYIEENIDVNNFVIKGINLWPLIRTEIAFNDYPSPFKMQNSNLTFNSIKFSIKSLFTLSKAKNKILFFSYAGDKSAMYRLPKGNLIHRQAYPLSLHFGQDNFHVIEFGKPNDTEFKNQTFNLSVWYLIYSIIYLIPFLFKKEKLSKKIENNVKRVFKDIDIDAVLKEKITQKIFQFFHRKAFFDALLKRLHPQKVILKSFGNVNAFAICASCNLKNIETIEYQHGQQGENSLMYSNWNAFPKEGYILIPKQFWFWHKIFEEKLKVIFAKNNFHKTRVVGNLWIELIRRNDIGLLNPKISTSKRNIMYCLQYPEVPDMIVNCIKNTPSVKWYLRLHPRSLNKINSIYSKLLSFGLSSNSFELEISNNHSFEELIPHMDVVVTHWSTVAYEALEYGKKSVVIDKNGKIAYREFIKKKLVHYTDTTEGLVNFINNLDT